MHEPGKGDKMLALSQKDNPRTSKRAPATFPKAIEEQSPRL